MRLFGKKKKDVYLMEFAFKCDNCQSFVKQYASFLPRYKTDILPYLPCPKCNYSNELNIKPGSVITSQRVRVRQ